MGASLVGQRVTLTVSEPRSFGAELGVGPHPGTVVAERVSPSEIILKMDDRFVHEGSDYSLAAAASRQVSVGFDRLLAGDQVSCDLVAVKPSDTSWEPGESPTVWVVDEASGLIGTLEAQASSNSTSSAF